MKTIQNARSISGVAVVIIQLDKKKGEPRIYEYDHPSILKATPCELCRDGQLIDLRTGEISVHKLETLLWPVFLETAFQYPDGKMFLYTRQPEGTRVYGEIDATTFSPTAMVKCLLKG
ncbi:MAG: hypothetical protein J6Y91_02400 [Alphaproteobacteria bacterium]|nr:hypothetical protein [Alphaproteobacteria bacterium]